MSKVLELGKYRSDRIQGTVCGPGPQSIIVALPVIPSSLGQKRSFTGNE